MTISDQISDKINQSITESESNDGDASNELNDQKKKMGRPRKKESEKYKSTHIRLHPKVLSWAKAEAKKRGIGYQSLINEILLEQM